MNRDKITKSTRQVWKLVISSTLGTFGSSVFAFALGLMLMTRTGSSISFALSMIIQPLLAILLLPIVGPLVDLQDRKKVIIVSQIGTILGLIFFSILYPITSDALLFPLVIFIVVVTKISDLFTSSAQMASKVNLVLEDDLTKLSGYQQTGMSLSGLFASIVGAAMFGLLPFSFIILFEALTEIITLVVTLTLDFKFNKREQKIETNSEISQWESFKEGLRYVFKQKYLFSFIVICVGLNFLGAISSVGIPVLMLKALKTSSMQYGLTDSFFAVGMIVSGVIIAKMATPKAPLQRSYDLTFVYAITTMLCGLTVFLSSNHWLATIVLGSILFIQGVNQNFLNTPLFVWMQSEIPEKMQGRVFSTLTSLSMGASPLGVALYGVLFDLPVQDLSQLCLWLFLVTGALFVLVSFSVKSALHVNFREARIINE